jgi:hypothetical protein
MRTMLVRCHGIYCASTWSHAKPRLKTAKMIHRGSVSRDTCHLTWRLVTSCFQLLLYTRTSSVGSVHHASSIILSYHQMQMRLRAIETTACLPTESHASVHQLTTSRTVSGCGRVSRLLVVVDYICYRLALRGL